MIGARILNIAKQDYDPQGASVTMLIAEEEAVSSGRKKPVESAILGDTILAHLDKSHVTVHTYPEFHPGTSIATFRVDHRRRHLRRDLAAQDARLHDRAV